MSKTKRNRGMTALAILLALLLAVGVAACGGGSSSSSSSAESTEAAAEPEEGGGEEGGSEAESGKHVSVAMEEILTGVSFGQELKEGAEAFAAEDGNVSLEVNGPPSTEPEVAQKQATDMLSKQPDAFGFAPFPPELWTRTAKTIWEQVGPNVLTFTERPASEKEQVSASPVQTFVGVNDREGAKQMMEKLIEVEKLPKSFTGEVILGQCVAQEAGVLAQRTEGFVEALSANLPNAKVVKFTSEVEPQANTEAWTTELAAKPNVALATGTCNQDGESLIKLKKEKGYKFILGTMELVPLTRSGIEEGLVAVNGGLSWWLEGYTAARMLTEAARGAEIPEGFVSVGLQSFTKENVAALKEMETEPAKFNAGAIEELFKNGMPETQPIEEAF